MRRMRARTPAFAAGMVLIAGAAGAASIAVACSSFTAEEAAPGNGEAGVDAAAGGDGQAVNDAGSESSASGFCSMHADATLCSDFDGMKVFDGWNRVVDDGGVLVTDTALYLSPPRSMRSALDGTSSLDARLVRPIPKTANRVRVSFELQVAQGPSVSSEMLSVVELYCSNGSNDEGAYVFVEGPSFDVAGYGGVNTNDRTPLPSLSAGAFTPIVLDAHFDGADPVANITIGKNPPKAVTISSSCESYPTFELRLGLSTFTSSMGRAFYDDVLVEIDPTGP